MSFQITHAFTFWSRLGNDCYVALKKAMCGTMFMKANQGTYFQTVFTMAGYNWASFSAGVAPAYGLNASGVWNYEYSLPSYLNHSICVDYTTKCAPLIALNSAVSLDCDAVDEDGIASYPNTTQAVVYVRDLLIFLFLSVFAFPCFSINSFFNIYSFPCHQPRFLCLQPQTI